VSTRRSRRRHANADFARPRAICVVTPESDGRQQQAQLLPVVT
jgi:hypothetical protein